MVIVIKQVGLIMNGFPQHIALYTVVVCYDTESKQCMQWWHGCGYHGHQIHGKTYRDTLYAMPFILMHDYIAYIDYNYMTV